MLKIELKATKIPSELLTQQFYDAYDIEYTNVKVLKFIENEINNFISWESTVVKIDLKEYLSDTSNSIITKKKK